jgi:ribosomal protein L14
MIGLKGRLTVIDNSGALIAECINVLKVKSRYKSTGHGTVGAYVHAAGCTLRGIGGCEHCFAVARARRPCFIQVPRPCLEQTQRTTLTPPGDEIVCVVNKARPIAQGVATGNIQKVRKGDVRRAVIVRTKQPVQRPDGRVVR